MAHVSFMENSTTLSFLTAFRVSSFSDFFSFKLLHSFNTLQTFFSPTKPGDKKIKLYTFATAIVNEKISILRIRVNGNFPTTFQCRMGNIHSSMLFIKFNCGIAYYFLELCKVR